MTKDLTAGKPFGVILRFTVPLLLTSLLQQCYNAADSAIVGHYLGAGPLAAVGGTGSINFLIIGFMTTLGSGFSIIVARYFGSGDLAGVRRAIGMTVVLSAIISAAMTVAASLLTRQILTWTLVPEDVFEDSYTYIFILFLSIPATMFYNVVAGILRALGDSRTPLICLTVTAVVNVVLNIVFIIYAGWGVAGVAIATVISTLLSGILCLIHIRIKLPEIHLKRDDFRFRPTLVGVLLYTGLPMALQITITALGTVILQSATNTFGSTAMAACTVGSKVYAFFASALEMLGVAMATYCGQNLGAGKIDRVRKGLRCAMAMGLAYCAVIEPVIILGFRALAQIFVSAAEEEVLTLGAEYALYHVLTFPALLSIYVFRSSIQGLGYSIPAMAAGLFEVTGRVLGAVLLAGVIGFTGIALASPIAWVFACVFLYPTYAVVIKKLQRQFPKGETV